MDYTSVGKYLSVGSDPVPDGCSAFDLVVLASRDHQHVGESFPCEVLRVPLVDDDIPPTVDAIKRAQSAAERIAYALSPWSVPYEVFKKYAPSPIALGGPGSDPAEKIESKRVLVVCEAGENRSLWLAGMALVMVGEQPSGKCAREHLQQLRGRNAFRNTHIGKLLDDYMPEWMKALAGRPSRPLSPDQAEARRTSYRIVSG